MIYFEALPGENIIHKFDTLRNSYIITDRRLLLRSGILHVRMLEINLAFCDDIQMAQSLGGVVLNRGDFRFHAGRTEIFLNSVPAPKKFKRLLNEAVSCARQSRHYPLQNDTETWRKASASPLK